MADDIRAKVESRVNDGTRAHTRMHCLELAMRTAAGVTEITAAADIFYRYVIEGKVPNNG